MKTRTKATRAASTSDVEAVATVVDIIETDVIADDAPLDEGRTKIVNTPRAENDSERAAELDADETNAGNDADEDKLEDEIEDDEDTESDTDEEEVLIFDADAEDLAEASRMATLLLQQAGGEQFEAEDESNVEDATRPPSMAELMSIIEALIFVSEEPLTTKMIAEVLKEDRGWVESATESLAEEFNTRGGGLQIREVAGGWQIATRAEHHEHVRQFLKSQPSAKLSLAALETLAVIAYKQPVTVPEILEIRGVQSSSAIKTLLEKRLIIAKGRKETIGRPMMYGTSREFLMQFGLKDLTELPSIEDFEDLAGT